MYISVRKVLWIREGAKVRRCGAEEWGVDKQTKSEKRGRIWETIKEKGSKRSEQRRYETILKVGSRS